MNKKASFLHGNIILLLVLVVFLAIGIVFISTKMNSGAFWADRTSKEIVKLVDSSKSGDQFILDVQSLCQIAKKNNLKAMDSIFSVSNKENKFCVKLSPSGRNFYYFFNEVNVSLELKQDPINGNKLLVSISDA